MRARNKYFELEKLIHAVSTNNFRETKEVIWSDENRKIFQSGDYRGPSFLVHAIRKADTEDIALYAAQNLLAAGHDPKSHHGRAFGIAARCGFSRVMDALKQHDVDIYAGNMYATIWALRKHQELLAQTIDEMYEMVFVEIQSSYKTRRMMIRNPWYWRINERRDRFLEDDKVLEILKTVLVKK